MSKQSQLTLELRKEMAELYPWVTRLKKPRQCQGWVGKASFTRGKFTCKHPAYWKFIASKRAMFASREYKNTLTKRDLTKYYCWNHLMSRGLYGEMGEYDRTRQYQDLHKDKFNGIVERIREIRRDNGYYDA